MVYDTVGCVNMGDTEAYMDIETVLIIKPIRCTNFSNLFLE